MPADVVRARGSRRVFERTLMAHLAPKPGATSVGYNLRALKFAADNVRERLSHQQRHLIERLDQTFAAHVQNLSTDPDLAPQQALEALGHASELLVAITGMQTDRMVRDDGWRMLSIGRLIERFSTLSNAMALGLRTECVQHDAGFEALLALFDSTITFHAQYQQRRDLMALTDMFVIHPDNPRSLAWVQSSLRSRLNKLPRGGGQEAATMLEQLARPRAMGPRGLGRAAAPLRKCCRCAVRPPQPALLQPRRSNQPQPDGLTPTMLLRILHHTQYRYEAPVLLAQHLAHLCPLDLAGQRVVSHHLLGCNPTRPNAAPATTPLATRACFLRCKPRTTCWM